MPRAQKCAVVQKAGGSVYARIARVEGRCLAQGRLADVEGAWEVRVFYEKKDPQRTLFCR